MIEPKRSRERVPVGWLVDPGTVLLEDQTEVPLPSLARGTSVWADGERLRALALAGEGAVLLWRHNVVGWSPDPAASQRFPVRALNLPVMPSEPQLIVRELARWRDWLHHFGARPQGSLGASGLSLVQATLRRPLWTGKGEPPPISYVIGGRQEQADHSYAWRTYRGELVQCDMVAAYAQTLGSVEYGGFWTRLSWTPARRRLLESSPSAPAFLRAQVSVPKLAVWLGPLPRRRRAKTTATEQLLDFLARPSEAYPVDRRLQGVWTWPELEQAEAAGCRVKVLDCYLHASHPRDPRPFEPWLEAVWQGRELSGFAGVLAKATGNATWGQFCLTPYGQRVVATKGDYRLSPRAGVPPAKRAYDLGEWICGSVRAALYAGMRSVGDRFICAHTDGLWSDGARVSGWRLDERSNELRFVNPQLYSFRDYDTGEWRYVASGMLDAQAGFEELWAKGGAA